MKRCAFAKFESPAEREVFAFLQTLAIRNNLDFEYQKKFGYQSGGFSSFAEWSNTYHGTEYDEEYRADFVIGNKFIIEIDGESFHQNKWIESKRDNYFMVKGYQVIHCPASLTLKKNQFINFITKETGLKVDWL